MQSCTEVREAVPSESLSGKVPPKHVPSQGLWRPVQPEGGTSVSFSSVDWCTGGNSSPPESGLVNLLLPPAEGRDLGEAMGWKGPGPPNCHVEVACHLQHFSWIHDCVRNLTSPSLKFLVLLK